MTSQRLKPWRWPRWLLGLLLAAALGVGLLVALVAAPIVWVESSCHAPRAGERVAQPDTRATVVSGPPWQRNARQTYLSYPEWYIVHGYDDFSAALSSGDESEFAYWRSISGYWQVFCALGRYTSPYGPLPGEWKVTLYIIGLSYAAEMAIKGVYENTVGALTAWWRGPEKTPEDLLALRVARDYAQFLRQVPWYEYPFGTALRDLWAVPWQAQAGSANAAGLGYWLRRVERRLALSAEFGLKAGYAQVIAWMAGMAPADLRLRSVVRGVGAEALAREPQVSVVQTLPDSSLVIETPRYRAFTELMQRLTQQGVQFDEIAGQRRVLITALFDKPPPPDLPYAKRLFALPTQLAPSADGGWVRTGWDVEVAQLGPTLAALVQAGGRFEHLYDF